MFASGWPVDRHLGQMRARDQTLRTQSSLEYRTIRRPAPRIFRSFSRLKANWVDHRDHAVFRRGERQVSKAKCNAFHDFRVRKGAPAILGVRDGSAAVNRELHSYTSAQFRVEPQSVLVAKAKAPKILPYDARDDLGRHPSVDRDFPLPNLWHLCGVATKPPRMSHGPEVAKTDTFALSATRIVNST